MMESPEDYIARVDKRLQEKLFNNLDRDPAQPHLEFLEQYRMLIDSTNKSEDRRGTVNNFFLAANGVFAPYLLKTFPLVGNHELSNLLILTLMVTVGLIVSIEWLSIIRVYEKLNIINYIAIKSCEEKLPLNVFSSKTELLAKHTDSHKANVFLSRETNIPKLFAAIYLLYLLLSIAALWIKI